MVDFDLVPGHAALINIDLQNCFVAAAQEGLAKLERVNRLAAACREAGILVVHTRHVLSPDGSDMGLLGDYVPRIRDGLLAKGSISAALHPRLALKPDDLILDKTRFSAFHGTKLESMLRARGIDTVIISGVSTDVCCDTTAREATQRDFKVLFLSDGTAVAGPNPSEVQHWTLKLVGALFGQVLSVDDLLIRIREAPPRSEGRR
jgi:ureidoacrylate peracid hydrolase